ncbi:MAG: DegT/DnrJ/EryC1/StrS family aminotransferase [Candidatus Bathyarchaeota archaeon]|nr:MAG: DegT/DnrJ/EryC1/StrS family aminotransferase [Candidatus Bathyarchaeota archaeon]
MVPIAKPVLGKDEEEAVRTVLQSGMLVQGEKVRSFEKAFADYIGVNHAIATANGTLALDITLKALKLSPGDEVIVPAFSFIATGNCVLFQRAKPVFADIDQRTFNIDPSDVNEKMTTKTKAIIAVHLYGHPANMEELKEIAEDHKAFLVEDAAQAHGAEYKGQKAGSIGNVGCFSFYATKNITTGEGGIIVTDNSELAGKARLLRNHGQTEKYHHTILGYNYRMTEISAAIGLVQLKKLEKITEKRVRSAEMLNERMRKIRGLTPPYVGKHVRHVFYQYVVRVEEDYPLERDELANHLKKKGVGTAVHYPTPIYRQPLYRNLGYDEVVCPVTEESCKRVLSLPVHPSVSHEDIQYITDACVH